MPANLDQVLAEIIDDALLDVHTALPAKVLRYDATKQRADLQPLVRVGGEALPQLLDVPVAWPSSGDAFLSLPLKPGHYVLVICTEESTEAVRAGGETGASAGRRHGFGGAYCIPGCRPDSQVLPTHADNIVVGFKTGVQIHLKPGGVVSLGAESPSQGVARGASTDSEISSLVSDITTLKAAVASGFGAVTPTGGGPAALAAFNSAAASTPHTPSSVESTVVKTE